MATKTVRKVVRIDEDRCNGCGACAPACAEGALHIVDGKARVVSDAYCDGLGACLGECPQGAISIEEREAEEFDQAAVERHLHGLKEGEGSPYCGCAGAAVTHFPKHETRQDAAESAPPQSMLRHWPVQLALVPPNAPFLEGADVVLAADCAPFAYAGFHRDFLRDRALLVACPKLDDFQGHLRRLIEILRHSDVKSLTVVHMDVPCCSGLTHMATQAIRASGREIPLRGVTIGVRGDVLS